MSRRELLAGLLAGGLTLLGVACGGESTEAQEPAPQQPAPQQPAPQQGAQRYSARGVVREIRRERRSVTIHHEEVPGYMPEMTMPFDLEDLTLLEGVSVGDTVEFTFSREEGGRHVIRSLRAS